MADPHPIQSSWCQKDERLDVSLRPKTLLDFAGQDHIKERLALYIEAANQRNEALGHCILHGPPGLGKTTLAHIIASSMGGQLTITSGPMIEKPGDLAGILTNLKEKDCLFIDEIHRLSPVIEEYLYSAMEDFTLDLMIDSGPSARSVQVKLNPFTLIGATTRLGLLSSPLRSRFTAPFRLDYYSSDTLSGILKRSCLLLGVTIDAEGAHLIATRSRGTPRIANNLLRWVRDFAQVHSGGHIDAHTAQKALHMLHIDHLGLDEMDKKILHTLLHHHHGGPVGINNLAAALSEEPHTIEEVYEPYLIMQGFIKRTPRGREATSLAYTHLGVPLPSKFKSGV